MTSTRTAKPLSLSAIVTASLVGLTLALAATPSRAEVIHINNGELELLMKQGVTLVDVRTPGEWKQTGVIAGSQLVQFVDERGRVDIESFTENLNAVAPPTQPVILICRTGNRTGTAARLLDARQPGRKIYNVRDGIVSWARAGMPIAPLQQNLQMTGGKCTPAC